EYRRALLFAWAAAAEGLDGFLSLPAFEDVDPSRVDQVGGDCEVEAARRTARLLHDVGAAGEVALSPGRVNEDLSGDDHHRVSFLGRPSDRSDSGRPEDSSRHGVKDRLTAGGGPAGYTARGRLRRACRG